MVTYIAKNVMNSLHADGFGKEQTMKSYEWWLGRKARVRKKYTLLLGRYLSPKELRLWERSRR